MKGGLVYPRAHITMLSNGARRANIETFVNSLDGLRYRVPFGMSVTVRLHSVLRVDTLSSGTPRGSFEDQGLSYIVDNHRQVL